MPNHQTPEEIQADIDRTLAELEKPEAAEDPEKKPAEEEIKTESAEEAVAEEESEETKEEVKTEKKPEEETKKVLPPVEERYKESTKEAQKLYRNNAVMNKAIEDANELPEPTEEELKSEFPEWAEMSATEQRFAKDSVINKQFRAKIAEASAEQRSIEKWEDRVSEYVKDPANLAGHPELEGKGDAFVEYVTKDKKLVGTDFDILVSAFLHDVQTNKPAPKKGKMFETGSAGPNESIKLKDTKLTPEEAEKLQQTDYNKWKQYLLAGKLQETT